MRDAVIVGAVRSPVGKRDGDLSGLHPAGLDDVIFGRVWPAGEQSWSVSHSSVPAAGRAELLA